MAAFGSFALLIALALAAYNLLAGAVALRLLATGQPARISPERLADTARRAGIAGFIAVTAAAFALVWSVFTNDFSITYILEHSNRALPGAVQVFRAVERAGGFAAACGRGCWATYGFVLRLTHKTDVKLYAYAGTILAGVQVFFLAVLNFAAPPFCAACRGAIPADGNGLNPLLQYPEMVIHPPMLYLGYVGFSVPFAFALGALMMRYPGEKWIKITRSLDHGDLAVSDLRHLPGHALGLRGAGLGRLLGLGPGGERQLHALAHGHRLSALGDDAGEERHDEELERVADLLHVPADAAGHAADARRAGEFGARLRAVVHRHVVRTSSW